MYTTPCFSTNHGDTPCTNQQVYKLQLLLVAVFSDRARQLLLTHSLDIFILKVHDQHWPVQKWSIDLQEFVTRDPYYPGYFGSVQER